MVVLAYEGEIIATRKNNTYRIGDIIIVNFKRYKVASIQNYKEYNQVTIILKKI